MMSEMIASGNMKQSIVGQAGGETEWDNTNMMFEKTRFSRTSNMDPVEAENRMMTMVDRMEKWNNQKKASKWSF